MGSLAHYARGRSGKPTYLQQLAAPNIAPFNYPTNSMSKTSISLKPASPDELLTEAEAAAMLKIAPSTLKAWRATKRTTQPAHCRIGGAVRYQHSAIKAFVEASVHQEEK
jgi:predicted DNA-binding transcriptional regulator AlpA